MKKVVTLLRASFLSMAKVMLMVAMIVSLGAGSTIVQLVGWATMIPTQLVKIGSMSEAVDNTFSGDFPCPMCELAAIQRAEASQDADSPALPNKQTKEVKNSPLISPTLDRVVVHMPRQHSFSVSDASLLPAQRAHAPETPPPDLV